MNGLRIKKVSKNDIHKIYKAEKEVFQDNAFTKSLLKDLISKALYFLKLIKGFANNMIGFAIVIKDRADRANIINFLIFPEYQGKGFGSHLLYNIIGLIKSNHSEVKKIVLNVKTSNIKALKLYEKFGFTHVEELKNYYQSGEASYFMELSLNQKEKG